MVFQFTPMITAPLDGMKWGLLPIFEGGDYGEYPKSRVSLAGFDGGAKVTGRRL